MLHRNDFKNFLIEQYLSHCTKTSKYLKGKMTLTTQVLSQATMVSANHKILRHIKNEKTII